MMRAAPRIGTILLVLTMGTSVLPALAQVPGTNLPTLGSCTRKDTDLFKDLPYAQWKQQYHERVATIIEGLLGDPVAPPLAQRRRATASNNCTENGVTSAPPELAALAARLDPWKTVAWEGTEDQFTATDIAPVLLEYLRVYECSLAERSFFLPIEIRKDELLRREILAGGYDANPFTYTELVKMTFEQLRDIQKELAIARPTLERALALTGTMALTGDLAKDVECLQRASLDIRNAVALSSDVAACMPKIWNQRDPLQDPAACMDGRDNDSDGRIDLLDTGCSLPTDTTE